MRGASILVIAVVVGGCRPLLGIDDPVVAAAAADAPPPDALVVDAPKVCQIAPAGVLVDRGSVGGGGGFPAMALACADGEMVVGIGVRMSDNPVNGFTKRSTHGLAIACASVRITSSGAVLGAVTTFEAIGTGASGWTPSTLSPVTQCDPGSVVTGLTAKIGGGLVFLDLTLACSALTADGIPMASSPRYVVGSLTETNGTTSAACAAGEILWAVEPRTGAGVDAVRLSCAPTKCL